jgi:hypothetical protein
LLAAGVAGATLFLQAASEHIIRIAGNNLFIVMIFGGKIVENGDRFMGDRTRPGEDFSLRGIVKCDYSWRLIASFSKSIDCVFSEL